MNIETRDTETAHVHAETHHSKTRFVQGLISVPLLAVVASVAIATARKTSDLSRQAICVENLKQIAIALERYYHEHSAFPPDYSEGDLRDALRPYVPNCDVFICPCDASPCRNSYSRYYARRPAVEEPGVQDYVIGCPRHFGHTRATNLFTGSHIAISRLARIEWSGGPLELGQQATGGVIRFEDGSKITLQGSHRAAVVQSIERQGVIYSVVRVCPGSFGSLSAETRKGSRLDVLTLAAIAKSQGTAFLVSTDADGSSTVSVESGAVCVQTFDGRSLYVHGGSRVKVPYQADSSSPDSVAGSTAFSETASLISVYPNGGLFGQSPNALP